LAEDELKENPGDEDSGEGGASRLAELEELVAQSDKRLAEANARIIELEQAVADRDGEITILRQSEVESGEELKTLGNTLADAVASYRALVIQANPGVPEELITGDSIETINQSLESAQNLVSRVKEGLEAEASRARVPAGAPERTPPDLSALSPREKIQYAIGGSSS
jgi:uncharacterized coiled-coil protein SlyX